jgi:translocation and assembly module TamB
MANPVPPSPAAPRATRRGLSPWLVVLLAIVLLLGAVFATVWWAARRDAGTAWLLMQIPGVRVTAPKGALIGDFEAGRVEVQLPGGGALILHGPGWKSLRIEPASGRPKLRIVIERLYANRVEVKPGTTTSTEPARPPDDLYLPIELVVQALQVEQIDAAPLGATPLRGLRARIHLGAGGGTQHRIDALALDLDRLHATGRLQIGAAAPMPLEIHVELAQQGAIADANWSASASLAGPLAEPRLQATLRATPANAQAKHRAPQSLDLSATLRPFAPWPLGEAQARLQGLDLSALHSQAPITALSGGLQARSEARDKPASLVAELSNAEAGRWNDGRLPLRSVRTELAVRPDDTGRIELRSFDAELGSTRQAAGRVQAQGRWAADTWSLDATLTAIRPALLDARAAAMQLGGPVQLRARAPAGGAPGRIETLDLKADLQGTLASPKPARAVQLRLDGSWHDDAQGQRVELREALASTGAARASLGGRATHAARSTSWQVSAQATLTEFDPLPWWPGREDSPWRAGPHRLNAKADVEVAVPVDAAASAPATAPATAPVRSVGIAERLAALRGKAHLMLANSKLAGVPLSGDAKLTNENGRQAVAAIELELDGNRSSLNGRLATRAGATDDQWDLAIAAPTLTRVAPLWRLVRDGRADAALAGSLNASAHVEGRWPAALMARGQADAAALRVDTVSVQKAEARWQLGTRLDAPVDAQLRLDGIAAGQAALESAQLLLRGTGRDHTLDLRAESKLRPPEWADKLQAPAPAASAAPAPSAAILAAQGGLIEGTGGGAAGWRGSLRQLELRSMRADVPAWLRTRDVGIELRWAAGAPWQAELQPGRAEVLGAALRWSRVAWRAADGNAAAQIEARAELEPLAVAPLLARAQPEFGWGGDLTVSGRIDIRSAPSFAADIVLERARGDLTVTEETGTQSLGLTDLRLALNAANGTWSFTQGLAGSTLGVAAGALVARTSPSEVWPPAETPIEGVLELRVANLGTWGTWVPAGWRLGGALRTSASIGGRFGAPEYTGVVSGQALSVRNYLQGVNVSDGEVAIQLQGASARIERFSARGGNGTLKLAGNASFGAAPQAQLTLEADKFQVLGRVDRRVVASGKAQLKLAADKLALDGKFGIDEGLIDFTRGDAPSLSDDVKVVRSPRPNGATAAQPAPGAASAPGAPNPLAKIELDLRVDLGEQLRLRGRGLDTGLRGELRVSSPGGRLAVNGTVRTAEGTYAAYGQKLTVDRGEISFNGPADNPRLDIEATRPNLDVRVGVAVTGTAVNPRVRLFSEPELSEMDKLSWLVLGRASDGLGRTDTALLQRAALALLSGEGPGATDQIINAIGLDEVSLRQSEGEVRETIVSLGKQLSRRWYVGYERSLAATAGTWQLVYRVAKRFTLRAQSGEDSSLDAIWTWRWQ